MVLPMWAFWLALVVMFIGLLGVFLPLVPGVGFIWLVALIYAIAEKFATIDPITFTILTILGALGVTSDIWMSKLGAKLGGASFRALLAGLGLGIAGAIIGIALGLVGIFAGIPFLQVGAGPIAIICALLGIFLVEWHIRGDWREALKVCGGWVVGCAVSGVVQGGISVLMILIFAWQALKG
ncbi:MAG: DUF456 family protein [Anaerolineae bacterium]